MDPYLQSNLQQQDVKKQNVQQLSNCPVNSLWLVAQNEWWLTPKQKLHSFWANYYNSQNWMKGIFGEYPY